MPINTRVSDLSAMMPVTQRNHETWRLPDTLTHLARPTLTMAVAWWGVLRGDFFSRHDVASAFSITPQRASGILTCVIKRASFNIEFEKKVQNRGPVRLLMIKIVSVGGTRVEEACAQCGIPVPHILPSGEVTQHLFMQVKTFMLQHRLGTPLPSDLLACIDLESGEDA